MDLSAVYGELHVIAGVDFVEAVAAVLVLEPSVQTWGTGSVTVDEQ
jgi:hypothetical protein